MWKYRHLWVAALPLVFAGCDWGNDNGPYGPGPIGPVGPQASVQFLHASPDAPPVNILIDGTLAVPNLYYGQGTGEQPILAGSHTIEVQALTPGTPTTVIGPTSVDFEQNSDYVIAAEGPVASIGAQTFTHVLSVVAPDATRVQILHAAPSAPSISVYLTAPGADLASSAPLGTIAFEGALGPSDVPSGSYEIRITPAGATSPVLFDSGTITLVGGDDLIVAAVQNTGPGTAPVVLAVVDSAGNDSTIFNVGTPSSVRVVHDSPDAPPVAVILDGNVTTPLVPSLAYPDFTAYVAVTPGVHDLEVTAASNTAAALINQSVNLYEGGIYSVYAVGDLAEIGPLITFDDDRRLATQAKLRIIHGSPSAGPVDVYLTAVGANIATLSPTYGALTFTEDTNFVSYAAGTYALTITPAGSKTAAIGPLSVTLKNTGIYTAVARDAAGGGAPFGLILLDDFAAAP
jgi:hypothetical protein